MKIWAIFSRPDVPLQTCRWFHKCLCSLKALLASLNPIWLGSVSFIYSWVIHRILNRKLFKFMWVWPTMGLKQILFKFEIFFHFNSLYPCRRTSPNQFVQAHSKRKKCTIWITMSLKLYPIFALYWLFGLNNKIVQLWLLINASI
jgi:hypothetical protein